MMRRRDEKDWEKGRSRGEEENEEKGRTPVLLHRRRMRNASDSAWLNLLAAHSSPYPPVAAAAAGRGLGALHDRSPAVRPLHSTPLQEGGWQGG